MYNALFDHVNRFTNLDEDEQVILASMLKTAL